MRRLVIAVDCDDVLVSTTPFFMDAYNKAHGTHLTLDDAGTDPTPWEAERSVIEERLARIMGTEEYQLLRPTQDAVDVLNELSKDHELHVVTARRPSEREATQRMLDRDLPGIFTSLELVGFEGSKGDVCVRLGVDILIDDSVHHSKDAIAKGIDSIVFGTYPWNKEVLPTGVQRCETWGEVQEVIDGRI